MTLYEQMQLLYDNKLYTNISALVIYEYKIILLCTIIVQKRSILLNYLNGTNGLYAFFLCI